MTDTWLRGEAEDRTVALVASTNDHVELINDVVQRVRRQRGQLGDRSVRITEGRRVHVGDVVVTRRNDRTLIASDSQPVHNRDTWLITALTADGGVTMRRRHGGGHIDLPTDYVREHLRLGYAATEHGYQADTVDHAIALATSSTSRRGLYAAATRGRDRNEICVVTDSHDVAEAIDVLEGIVAIDRADVPAVAVRQQLAAQRPRPTRTPRCVIPEWFPGHVEHVRQNLDRLRGDRQRWQRRLVDLETDLLAAEDALRAAEQCAAPAHAAIGDACHQAKHAQDVHPTLLQQVAAGRRERRRLGPQLAEAERRLEEVLISVREVEKVADSAVQQVRNAANRRDRLRNDRGQHRSMMRSTDAQIVRAERSLSALHTWRDWAEGRHLTDEQLATTYLTFTAAAGAPETRQLLEQWGMESRVDHARDEHRNAPRPLEIGR